MSEKEEKNEKKEENSKIKEENKNKEENLNNKEENKKEEKEQPKQGFFRKYFWYILIFIGYQFVSRIIKYFQASSGPQLDCILEEGTIFDVNFYLSNNDHYSSVKGKEPIYTIKNLIFSYNNFSTYSMDNEVFVEYNISHLYKRKNHKYSKIYLISELKFSKNVFNKLNKQHGLHEENLYNSMNILKYVEDLTGLLNSAKDLDDMNVGRDFQNNKTNENNSNIPKLYYKNNFCLYLVRTGKKEGLTIFQTYNFFKVPLRINTQRMAYFPIFALNDFWSMDSELTPINKTKNGLFGFKLYLGFNYIRNFWFSNMLGVQFNEKEIFEKFSISGVKDMLVELIRNNSTFYLVILFTVNTLHTIFSYLGFSSDITYYNNLKKLDGVYTKYIFFNIFSMFITLIYILLQGANFLVKVELFISFAIEIWKLKKIFKTTFEFNSKFPYFIKLEYKQGFEQEEARDYETEAVDMMVKYLLFPIGVCYLGYRIYYYSDNIIKSNLKSFVIFIIEYIYFLLNVFGFILLTPQIYLNYKLKSVEHLPMKAMTYKFLNTIIDDLYAFAVKSPTLYRIFCFRDDVIFVIYIYQIFKYRKNNRAEQLEKDRKKYQEEKKKIEDGKNKEKPKKD